MVAVAATVTMLAVMLPARQAVVPVAVAAAVLAGHGRCRRPGSECRRSR